MINQREFSSSVLAQGAWQGYMSAALLFRSRELRSGSMLAPYVGSADTLWHPALGNTPLSVTHTHSAAPHRRNTLQCSRSLRGRSCTCKPYPFPQLWGSRLTTGTAFTKAPVKLRCRCCQMKHWVDTCNQQQHCCIKWCICSVWDLQVHPDNTGCEQC
jgi:hypothetical protein